MESPKHLSHKPIISVNDYEKIDSKYANKTDAVALSIGIAQYDSKQISLKVWRHSGKRWSRQSEELPIHRNLDLSILFLAALLTDETANYSQSNLRETIDEKSPGKVNDIKSYYKNNKQYLEPRLNELKQLLNKLV